MTAKNTVKKIRTFVTEYKDVIIASGSVIVSAIAGCYIYKYGSLCGFRKGFESCNRIVIMADPVGYPILQEKANAIINNNELFKTN